MTVAENWLKKLANVASWLASYLTGIKTDGIKKQIENLTKKQGIWLYGVSLSAKVLKSAGDKIIQPFSLTFLFKFNKSYNWSIATRLIYFFTKHKIIHKHQFGSQKDKLMDEHTGF